MATHRLLVMKEGDHVSHAIQGLVNDFITVTDVETRVS